MTEKMFTLDDVHITAEYFISRQICVPKEMSIEIATQLLNQKDWCGTTNGWSFREELGEVTCEARPGHKHLVFEA